MLKHLKKNIDWVLFFAILPLLGAGLLTMNSFSDSNYFFSKQIVWVSLAVLLFFGLSFVDFRFLKKTGLIVALFSSSIVILIALYFLGKTVRGAQSWFNFGAFSFQPADLTKLVIILVLAKYFSRRHVEIAHFRHILVSGFYAFVPFVLVFLQPDFGSAIIIFLIWLGMTMVSGISKKHLLLVVLTGLIAFSGLWFFGFTDIQKQRIVTFVNPLTDIQGAGYNAIQSTIAVGSGQVLGKGVGYGTQSRLNFLPEYETDFIFSAFAEEWGFVGVLILFFLFAVVVWRILASAVVGDSNFETLFAAGFSVMLMSHFAVHIGMNIGLLPITGLPLPFLSYGGSHLITEFIGLGMLMGMRRYHRATHRDNIKKEFFGM